MAKIEEADPRWKVRDLGDQGKNVNGWHWTENDCLPWFKEKFEACFSGDDNKILSDEVAGGSGLKGELTCYKLETCTGEAHINRRKGNKVMVIYEMELKVKWKAVVSDKDGNEVSSSKGNFNIPCLDTVDEIDEFEIHVKFNKDNDAATAANKYAKVQGEPKVRALIVDTIKQLQREAGVGQKIPKDGAAAPAAPAAGAPPASFGGATEKNDKADAQKSAAEMQAEAEARRQMEATKAEIMAKVQKWQSGGVYPH
eukprot:CAMPEP_0173378294 /NCGR_PEP_ID=MMETSP1356-20130122/1475_1 /TAXON_ID=77927 ORGANISM="Hemiselmis virescens, Strain PCC157" /NCGR_SAMPLE_ID=MMETSP1356 /ASSEMBLY_ACC=CAM_ASM_000847 /LENGTH=254 /DNA_ID=CAMNT_0014331319 /DNA_START=50 /DNA_END=814 /DNA_ORIENTATION=+